MITLERLKEVKVMPTLHDVYKTIPCFKKILQISCNRFKQIIKTRWWSKGNTTN